MKNKNPYSQILGVMKGVSEGSNSPDIKIGQIVTPPPAIQISYNGILLEKNEVWISQYLLVGYERQAKGTINSNTQDAAGGSGDAQYASHNHAIANSYTENIVYTDTLQAGDYVAIMPMVSDDGSTQQYIVLDKIVHL